MGYLPRGTRVASNGAKIGTLVSGDFKVLVLLLSTLYAMWILMEPLRCSCLVMGTGESNSERDRVGLLLLTVYWLR